MSTVDVHIRIDKPNGHTLKQTFTTLSPAYRFLIFQETPLTIGLKYVLPASYYPLSRSHVTTPLLIYFTSLLWLAFCCGKCYQNVLSTHCYLPVLKYRAIKQNYLKSYLLTVKYLNLKCEHFLFCGIQNATSLFLPPFKPYLTLVCTPGFKAILTLFIPK